jgi:soluble lytic murein transglycosylase-like protein
MSVESCQITGETAKIVLRDGGEMQAPRSIIAEVLPDEYFHAMPVPLPPPLTPATAIGLDAVKDLVERLAARYGVDTRLAHAVVKTESNYEPRAVSRKGAVGLMQIMPAVVAEYSVADPFNPEQNVDAGMRHLRGLLDRFSGDVRIALAAYNAGAGAVAKYGGIPPYRETQDYVQRIMALVARGF